MVPSVLAQTELGPLPDKSSSTVQLEEARCQADSVYENRPCLGATLQLALRWSRQSHQTGWQVRACFENRPQQFSGVKNLFGQCKHVTAAMLITAGITLNTASTLRQLASASHGRACSSAMHDNTAESKFEGADATLARLATTTTTAFKHPQ